MKFKMHIKIISSVVFLFFGCNSVLMKNNYVVNSVYRDANWVRDDFSITKLSRAKELVEINGKQYLFLSNENDSVYDEIKLILRNNLKAPVSSRGTLHSAELNFIIYTGGLVEFKGFSLRTGDAEVDINISNLFTNNKFYSTNTHQQQIFFQLELKREDILK